MDPITATTTLITLATFIKDLIEVGQSIQRSIEKVGENRRRIRELTNDVLRTLSDLASLIRGARGRIPGAGIVKRLRESQGRPGFRGFGSQIKVWMKRDELETKIGRLKEHVNKCYIQFTAFSTARIERTTSRIVNSTLRVEQTLIVNNEESKVKLRRLEGMMARVLLETQFGQNVLNQTTEIIASDPNHTSLESQYLSVQTTRLMDSFQQLLISGELVLHEPLWDPDEPFQPVFLHSTPSDTLHQILGAVIKVNESPAASGPITLKSMENIVVDIGVHLSNIGMTSEAIAWEHLKIRVLHYLDGGKGCMGTLLCIAHALSQLSTRFNRQLQFQHALQASQQSLDLWHQISESLPEVDNRTGQLLALIAHAQNLLKTGQGIAALSTAQDAVAISRPMADEVKSRTGMLSLTDEDQFKSVRSRDALFTLAEVLSSVEQHLESYTVFREGFQAVLHFPVSTCPPIATDIDSFLDQICKVAEEGTFSLSMLADCVTLFRDLAYTYPKEASFQFLQLFHAYIYLLQHNTHSDSGSAFETLRFFIEPTKDHPTPKLDITMCIDINSLGILIEDVVRAYYTCPSHTFDLLMWNIFITHFEQAVVVLRETVERSSPKSHTITWVLYNIADIVQLVPKSKRMSLLQMMSKIVQNFGAVLAHWHHDFQWLFEIILTPIFIHLCTTGFLDNALATSDKVMEYFHSKTDIDMDERLWWLRSSQPFILSDMGRIFDATVMIQQIDRVLQDRQYDVLRRCIIRNRILQRTRRNQEALQMLRRTVAVCLKEFWSDKGQVFNLHFHFLLVELAAAQGNAAQPERALKDAEWAVSACQKADDADAEARKCTVVHALTTFSNCLAAVGRNEEALTVVEDAVAIYTQNVEHMWDNYLFSIRKEELGANAFHSLSLRLATLDKPEEALVNANKATELYRELVTLAPGHLPTLTSSLRNLASILSNIGRRAEALSTCVEAVHIMRMVVDREPKVTTGAAAAANEDAEDARGRFADLPPQPEFLFEQVEMEWEDEVVPQESKADEGWETVSEGNESEYHEALDTPTDVQEMFKVPEIEPEHSIVTESLPTLKSRAAILELNTTDTAISAKGYLKDILSMPLEVRLSLRSTPMDVLWWLLTGILFAVVWSRLV
ncbi:Tetratricopeptide repeat family [Mycena venus]|uniref:Tetratricopeptide repeat family n=1 Tax=Mycena venus TaxID=2733690 RepID=A0A8H6YBB2_9AGAR|nr:Tetratricopeptide repeat family [Mycena venus]